MGNAVNDNATLTADAFTAVRVECDGLFTTCEEFLIEDVEHFKEGRLLGDSLHLVLVHRATVLGTILAPDLQCQVHL